MSEKNQAGATLRQKQHAHTLPGHALPHGWPPRHLHNIQAGHGFESLKNTNFKVKSNQYVF